MPRDRDGYYARSYDSRRSSGFTRYLQDLMNGTKDYVDDVFEIGSDLQDSIRDTLLGDDRPHAGRRYDRGRDRDQDRDQGRDGDRDLRRRGRGRFADIDERLDELQNGLELLAREVGRLSPRPSEAARARADAGSETVDSRQ
ncbi:hypothetical protein ACGFNU_39610 [Spirillospora sp. NPDC048911]|uniref:hypothetical protein n=1 Tax=Spirillospora sp. NPDC048911 TaxID=3364527 RepID=UPI003711C7BF